MGVLSVLPGGPATGKHLASNPLVRKVDITAGTQTGRQLGGIVGSNLASFTAELGGKVRGFRLLYSFVGFIRILGPDSHFRRRRS